MARANAATRRPRPGTATRTDAAVSPVMATLLLVALAGVLATALYTWIDAPDAARSNTSAIALKQTSPASASALGGPELIKLTVQGAAHRISWHNVAFQLADRAYTTGAVALPPPEGHAACTSLPPTPGDAHRLHVVHAGEPLACSEAPTAYVQAGDEVWLTGAAGAPLAGQTLHARHAQGNTLLTSMRLR